MSFTLINMAYTCMQARCPSKGTRREKKQICFFSHQLFCTKHYLTSLFRYIDVDFIPGIFPPTICSLNHSPFSSFIHPLSLLLIFLCYFSISPSCCLPHSLSLYLPLSSYPSLNLSLPLLLSLLLSPSLSPPFIPFSPPPSFSLFSLSHSLDRPPHPKSLWSLNGLWLMNTQLGSTKPS